MSSDPRYETDTESCPSNIKLSCSICHFRSMYEQLYLSLSPLTPNCWVSVFLLSFFYSVEQTGWRRTVLLKFLTPVDQTSCEPAPAPRTGLRGEWWYPRA